jgi:hypothetical protein
MYFSNSKKIIFIIALLLVNWGNLVTVYAKTQLLVLQVSTPGVKQSMPMSYEWDDAWFAGEKDAYTYNHGLARISGALMSTVYLQPKYQELTTMFEELGCSMDTLEDHHYEAVAPELPDKSGYSFCTKYLEIDGRQVPLVFVVIRGTNGRQEWYSNADIADSAKEKQKYHEGFANSAWMIGQDLKTYMEKHGLREQATRIVITGHSRGAAVANLLGAFLDTGHYVRNEADPVLMPGHIYVYAFAPANSCSDLAERRSERYGNIFNIVNPEDVVPELPFTRGSWGYGSYGTIFRLPTANNLRGDMVRYQKLLEKMQIPFGKLTGRKYTPVPGSEWLARDIKGMQWSVGSVKDFYRSNLVLNHSGLRDALSSEPVEEDEHEAFHYGGIWGFMAKWFPKEKAGFEDMHGPATYNAWILSGEPSEIYMHGTPSIVSIRLDPGELVAAGGSQLKQIVEHPKSSVPFNLKLQIPGGETLLRLANGTIDSGYAHSGYKAHVVGNQMVWFTVPEDERIRITISAPQAVKLKISLGLEANNENDVAKDAVPLVTKELALSDGGQQTIEVHGHKIVP